MNETSSVRILVVDDDAVNRRLLSAVFKAEGFEVKDVGDGHSALIEVAAAAPSVVLLDIHMPGMDGIEVLRRLRAQSPQVAVIMLTSDGEVDEAVEAIKLGAFDFLTRPIDNDKLVLTVRRTLERQDLVLEVDDLRRQLHDGPSLVSLMGTSQVIDQLAQQVRQVARSGFTVLIQGETGVGKEIVASAIHRQSDRGGGPFVAIDCGAIPENLIESELFGHEKGAFTGADRRTDGQFQRAQGGTVFLDEVGNLPVGMQAKLLRTLQERRVQRVGSCESVPLDVRFVAATNEPLDSPTLAERFRRDLYYRLAEFTIAVPPLRTRPGDIPALARRFQQETCSELRQGCHGLTDTALELLVHHEWPGNVRQLRNVVRQAALASAEQPIGEEHVRPLLTNHGSSTSGIAQIPLAAGASLKEISNTAKYQAERQAIIEALRQSKGNITHAARQLHVDFKTLHVKIKRYGLSRREALLF